MIKNKTIAKICDVLFAYDNSTDIESIKQLSIRFEVSKPTHKGWSIHPISYLTQMTSSISAITLMFIALIIETINIIVTAITITPIVGVEALSGIVISSFLISLIPAIIIAMILCIIIDKLIPMLAMKLTIHTLNEAYTKRGY